MVVFWSVLGSLSLLGVLSWGKGVRGEAFRELALRFLSNPQALSRRGWTTCLGPCRGSFKQMINRLVSLFPEALMSPRRP